MNTNFKQLPMLLGAGLVLAQAAVGDGYRNPPPTAEGIAKSGVNSVWVNDASAISYNPANLAFQTNKSVVISTTFAQTDNTYFPAPATSFDSSGDWNVLPNIYYSQPIGDKGLSVGLGITTPYGQGLAWNESDFEKLIAGPKPVIYEASVMMLDFNPTVAFKVNDYLSIGVGVDIYYSTLELDAVGASGAPPAPLYNATGEGDAFGLGANIGITWLPTEAQRVALTYRSEVEMEYKGDFSSPLPNNGNFETSLQYPNIVGLGYGVQFAEKFKIEALAEWLQWSLNESQSVDAGGTPLNAPNNWDDTFTFGIGGSWDITDSFVLRAGYAYLPSPIPSSTLTPLLPDADRQALSFGLGYTFGMSRLDVAYTYSIYDELADQKGGTYDIDSNLIGLSYSTSF
ncbi:outer membrane protein transport protein [Pontiellaceae bacterium B12219]|nr:outer membrane protein transport protein [Pontiellaceae bacterium B12219]